ncbi:hypothetical protein GJ496_008733 [Pomphorhynchus laevis]|nr:hypothetical protein GJ496_008733 [Pomphorhynchus laevis]
MNATSDFRADEMILLKSDNKHLVSTLEQSIENAVNLKENLSLSLKLNPLTSHYTLQINDNNYECGLMNLPTVLEAYRTSDKILFHKLHGVGSLLVCNSNESTPHDVTKGEMKDGITPPMKNVNDTIFRTNFIHHNFDPVDLNSYGLRRLLEEDFKANRVEYNVICDDLSMTGDDTPLTELEEPKVGKALQRYPHIYLKNRYRRLQRKRLQQKSTAQNVGQVPNANQAITEDQQLKQLNVEELIGYMSDSD